MKPLFQTDYRCDLTTTHTSAIHRASEMSCQVAAMPKNVRCRWSSAGNTAFHSLSQDYFEREAHHDFASEAAVFCLLTMTTVLPLLNAAAAVLQLISST